jgi:hypothetical protein
VVLYHCGSKVFLNLLNKSDWVYLHESMFQNYYGFFNLGNLKSLLKFYSKQKEHVIPIW